LTTDLFGDMITKLKTVPLDASFQKNRPCFVKRVRGRVLVTDACR